MKCDEIRVKYHELTKSLGTKNLVLSTGAALVLYGVRDATSTLDVGAPEWIVGDLIDQYGCYEFSPIGCGVLVPATLKVYLHEAPCFCHVVDMDGVYVYGVDYLIDIKERLLELPATKRSSEKKAVDGMDLVALLRLRDERRKYNIVEFPESFTPC